MPLVGDSCSPANGVHHENAPGEANHLTVFGSLA